MPSQGIWSNFGPSQLWLSRGLVRPHLLFLFLLELLLGLFLQHPPEDLARDALGDRVDELDAAAQLFVVGDLVVHPLDDVLGVVWLHGARTALPHDVRPGHLGAELDAVDAHHGHVVDLVVGRQVALQLGRRDLEPFVLDEFLDAVRDGQVAALVEEADVAGPEPAVLQALGRRGGVVVVPQEHVGPPDVQLADLAPRQFLGAVGLLARGGHGAELGLQVRHHHARRAHGAHPRLPGLHEDGRAGLAEAVPLLDAHALPFPERLDQVARERGGARVRHPQRAEVVLFHRGVLAQQQHDRRHDVAERHLVVLHEAAPLLQVEPGHHQRVDPLEDRQVDETVEPVDVEKR